MTTPNPPERLPAVAPAGFAVPEKYASGETGTNTYDPLLDAEHRGERRGLRAAEREYGRGFYDGVLVALVCITIGAALVVLATWIFTR